MLAIVSVVGAAAVPPKILGVMVSPATGRQLTVEVRGARTPPGVAVCVQVSVAETNATPGTQLKPIAGALAPKAAGPVMVRFAPPVIANAEAPVAGMVHANAKLPPAVPAVATKTGTEPTPPVKATGVVSGPTVGAAGPPEIAKDPSTLVQVVGEAFKSIHPLPGPVRVTGSGIVPVVKAAKLVKAKLQ